MDRFYWFDGNLKSGNEREVIVTKNVRLYDGDDKVKQIIETDYFGF